MTTSDALLLPLLCYITMLITDCLAEECRMDACSLAYDRTLEYEGLTPQREERYCEVLNSYHGCLNATAGFCRGELNYHSTVFFTRRRLKDFHCDKILAAAAEARNQLPVPENRCRLLPSSPSAHSLRHCAFWGDPHLRTFDGRLHACAEAGARPLIDNRYFLIQVSSGRVREDTMVTAVTKITLIIREHNCTTAKRYEATSESADLPVAFIDGTTHSTVDEKRAIEVLQQSSDHIEILLRHAATVIHIRRKGPYLSIAVTLPQQIIAQSTESSFSSSLPLSEQLCHAGCPLHAIVPLAAALANAQAFSDCHAAPVHVPVKLATERCKAHNVTDDFFDACVFDVALTGDEVLAVMSRDAQSDLENHLAKGQPYSVGRVDLSPYDHLAEHKWTSCLPSSSSLSSSLQTIIAFLSLATVLRL